MTATTSDDVLAGLGSEIEVPEVKTDRYHIGIVEDMPPRWFLPLKGVTFSVTTSKFDAQEREIRLPGSYVELTVEQVKAVRDELVAMVVRWRRDSTGKVMGADVYDRRIRAVYSPQKGDEPLAKYLYFRKAPLEVEQPRLAEQTIAALDAAIKDAEASEDRAVADPADARTRELHGQAKKAGRKLTSDESGI